MTSRKNRIGSILSIIILIVLAIAGIGISILGIAKAHAQLTPYKATEVALNTLNKDYLGSLTSKAVTVQLLAPLAKELNKSEKTLLLAELKLHHKYLAKSLPKDEKPLLPTELDLQHKDLLDKELLLTRELNSSLDQLLANHLQS